MNKLGRKTLEWPDSLTAGETGWRRKRKTRQPAVAFGRMSTNV
jgi:hypothetical protein